MSSEPNNEPNNGRRNVGMPPPLHPNNQPYNASNNTRKNNKSLLNSAREFIGLGGKRSGTRKGRKGSCRKNTRKAQAGGKRKMNGYMRFAAEQRKTMGKTSNVVSQAREIGKRWRALSDAEKARYQK